jgi:hypothetical protein
MHGNFTLAIIDPVAHPCSYVIVNHMNVPYIVLSNFIEFYSLDRAAGRCCVCVCVCVVIYLYLLQARLFHSVSYPLVSTRKQII